MTLSYSTETLLREKADYRFGKEDVLPLLALTALCIVLFFFRIGAAPLWDVDEGMHAATSKDMVQTGDWVTPKSNGENFYDKTALFNWLVALSLSVFGFTELAARLPAALLGLAAVLLTYAIGRRLYEPRLGLLGGAILATSPQFIILSRSVVHDISLAFFITAALAFFYQAYTSGHRRRLNLMLFYASAGVAVLAKGPIGILLPGLIIFLFLLLRGRLSFLKEMSMGWGALVFIAVAAPWYVLISLRNSDYVSYFFLQQNFGNFLSKAQSRHPRPFYYYVPALVAGMLPWSFFVPLAIVRPLADGIKKIEDRTLFLLCWFAAIFLFFSAASSKLETYLLPAFPAVALLIAMIWLELVTSTTARLRKGMGWSLGPLPVLFLGATAYIMIKQPSARKLETLYGMHLYDLRGLLIVLTVILAIALLFFLYRKYREAFWALAATFTVGFLLFVAVYVPKMDPYRSTRTLTREMDRMLPAGKPLVFFWRLRDSGLFYTNRRAVILYSKEELIDYLTMNKKPLCVIEQEQYEKFPDVEAISRVIDKEGNKLLIEGNRNEWL